MNISLKAKHMIMIRLVMYMVQRVWVFRKHKKNNLHKRKYWDVYTGLLTKTKELIT